MRSRPPPPGRRTTSPSRCPPRPRAPRSARGRPPAPRPPPLRARRHPCRPAPPSSPTTPSTATTRSPGPCFLLFFAWAAAAPITENGPPSLATAVAFPKIRPMSVASFATRPTATNSMVRCRDRARAGARRRVGRTDLRSQHSKRRALSAARAGGAGRARAACSSERRRAPSATPRFQSRSSSQPATSARSSTPLPRNSGTGLATRRAPSASRRRRAAQPCSARAAPPQGSRAAPPPLPPTTTAAGRVGEQAAVPVVDHELPLEHLIVVERGC